MKPSAKNDLQTFDVTDPDNRVYETLPEWLTKQIDACVERTGTPQSTRQASAHAGAAARTGTGFDDMDDDIPF